MQAPPKGVAFVVCSMAPLANVYTTIQQ
jgi:hypothetical protein